MFSVCTIYCTACIWLQIITTSCLLPNHIIISIGSIHNFPFLTVFFFQIWKVIYFIVNYSNLGQILQPFELPEQSGPLWHRSSNTPECCDMINYHKYGSYLLCMGNDNIKLTKCVWLIWKYGISMTHETHGLDWIAGEWVESPWSICLSYAVKPLILDGA